MVMMMMAGAPVLNARTPKQSVNNKQNIKNTCLTVTKERETRNTMEGTIFLKKGIVVVPLPGLKEFSDD